MIVTCKDFVLAVSSEEKTSIIKKVGLGLHMILCKYCRNYQTQMTMLKNSFKRLFQMSHDIDPAELAALEEQIVVKMLQTKQKQ